MSTYKCVDQHIIDCEQFDILLLFFNFNSYFIEYKSIELILKSRFYYEFKLTEVNVS